MPLPPLDFPPSPTLGQTYPDPPVTGKPTYKWTGTDWISNFALGKEYVPVDGTVPMTGLLTLSGDPVNPLHAVTKRYVADTATGFVSYLPQTPTTAQQLQARTNIGVATVAIRGYLAGLTLSWVSGTTFGVAVGVATDSTSTFAMSLTSAFTKTTGLWTAGTGNGGLDTGSIGAAAWYHVFLIRNPTTSAVDVVFSATATPETGPTGAPVAAGFTQFRRIGSLKTTASNWLPFTQFGDEFFWVTTVADVTDSTLSTAVKTYILTGVPTGISVTAFMRVTTNNAAACFGAIFTPYDTATTLATVFQNVLNTAGIASASNLFIRTNTAAQFKAVSQLASTTITARAYGWKDMRGRDD